MDSRKSYFSVGGNKSTDYGIILTKAPTMQIPERDVQTITVPGRSGDLVIDNGRYKNAAMEFECLIIPPQGQTMREAAAALMAAMLPVAYARIADSFDPAHFCLARASGGVSVESLTEQGGRFTLEYDRMPQRYRVDGETPVTLTGSGTIQNPTAQTARPLLKVSLSGAGAIVIGGTRVEISAGETTLYLDCESQNAYALDAGVAVNRNNLVNAPEFPALAPGSNAVTLSGGVSRVEITPRWWDL